MATKEQLQNVLRLARADLMVRQLEEFYKGPDVEDGPLCLASVIIQGAERFAINVTMQELEAAITEDWAAAKS